MSTPHDAEKGKFAKSDQIYFRIRRFDNAVFAVRLKNPSRNNPPTPAQEEAQQLFTDNAAKLKLIFADETQKAELKEAWLKQRKYKTFTGYVFHHVATNQDTQHNEP